MGLKDFRDEECSKATTSSSTTLIDTRFRLVSLDLGKVLGQVTFPDYPSLSRLVVAQLLVVE